MSRHSFTRHELYDLVWSEPMVKLAERYGISGNGLAKACRRAGIPVPGTRILGQEAGRAQGVEDPTAGGESRYPRKGDNPASGSTSSIA